MKSSGSSFGEVYRGDSYEIARQVDERIAWGNWALDEWQTNNIYRFNSAEVQLPKESAAAINRHNLHPLSNGPPNLNSYTRFFTEENCSSVGDWLWSLSDWPLVWRVMQEERDLLLHLLQPTHLHNTQRKMSLCSAAV